MTAAFNRNVLVVINRELGADFDVEQFDHVALWNASEEWIEMRLRSRRAQRRARCADLDMEVAFAPGEDLLTEISAKFTPERLGGELEAAGFVVDAGLGCRRGRVPPHPGPPLLLTWILPARFLLTAVVGARGWGLVAGRARPAGRGVARREGLGVGLVDRVVLLGRPRLGRPVAHPAPSATAASGELTAKVKLSST